LSHWAQGKIVVLGAGGMLAHDLITQLRQQVDREKGALLTWGRTELDITNQESVRKRLRDAAPTIVINCAAYTDVDGCESNQDQAMAVNAEGPAFVAETCQSIGTTLVHFSTDFVFDGTSGQPYRTSDASNPLSAYGKSKFAGVRAVLASGCRSLVIRTSWLFGPHGRNFVDAILSKASRGEALRVVHDQVGRPTYTVDLSAATLRLINAHAEGTVHFANSGFCSWHEFAVEIVRSARLDVPVGTLSSHELGRPAKRPAYSVLDLSSYEEKTGESPRHWKEALAEYLERRKSGEKAG